MANIKSQIKRNRRTRRPANATRRSARSSRPARRQWRPPSPRVTGVEEALTAAIRRIDMAATKGVLHKNTAARRKSRLVKKAATSQGESDS